jgi:hypothetical protein
MKPKPVLTKERMKATAVFLTSNDFKIWLEAATAVRMSRSELLRQALRKEANEILGRSLDRKAS